MKVFWKGIKFEYHTVVVKTRDVDACRQQYESEGWTFVSRSDREDGKSELSFQRRELGTVEVTP